MINSTDFSEVTQHWVDLVVRGGIETTTVLKEDRRICGREIPKGTSIKAWLTMVNGEPKPFAQIVGGDELNVRIVPRPVGGFIILLSDLRSIRPGAVTNPPIGRQPEFVSPGEKGCKFECAQVVTPLSLLRRVPLMEVKLKNGDYAVLPNAAFFDPRGHVLLVPIEKAEGERKYPHRPQWMTLADLEDLFWFQELNPDQLGFFNSIHAGATVDHIHAQSVYHGEQLAIEKASTNRHGEVMILGEDYPARGLVFDRHEAPVNVYKYVDRLQRRGIPFNLIVTGEKIFLIPRDRYHEVLAQFPTGVLASMEMAGKAITDDERVFACVTLEEIVNALRLTTLKNLDTILD